MEIKGIRNNGKKRKELEIMEIRERNNGNKKKAISDSARRRARALTSREGSIVVVPMTNLYMNILH